MTNSKEKVRVFVALDLPQSIKELLEATIRQLEVALPQGIRWVNPAGIHLTLKFLGDVDSEMVGGLLAAMDQAAARFRQPNLTLGLSELGVFPNHREPRVLWAGVAGEIAALSRLQQSVDTAIADLGFARERRPFRPHLTLGRVRDRTGPAERLRIGRTVSQFSLPDSSSWQVQEVHLIQSVLTPRGAIYSSLGRRPLHGPN